MDQTMYLTWSGVFVHTCPSTSICGLSIEVEDGRENFASSVQCKKLVHI